ncbi:MAG: MgtC/SapB family protein [Bacillota bacterium]|nr:MgtC/SapB family protein [Bacillota bacterium]
MQLEWIGRIVLAGVLAAAIGLERQYHYKEAGLRTHFLVGVGAATLMVLSKHAFADMLGQPGVELDPSRIASQVVTGVGFIGAGTIVFRRNLIYGLTTAAGLWATSAVGMAVGAGMYGVGVATSVLILGGLWALDWLARRLAVRRLRHLVVTLPDQPGEIGRLGTALGQLGVNIARIEVGQAHEGRLEIELHLSVPGDMGMDRVAAAVERLEGMQVTYRARDRDENPASGSRREAGPQEANRPQGDRPPEE